MRHIITFILIILLTSLASAEIIIQQQPNSLYNLGDTLNLPVKVIAPSTIKSYLNMNLICNEKESSVYKNGINLTAGEERAVSAIILLERSFIEDISGKCVVKISLGTEEPVFTNEFKLSNYISVSLKNQKIEANPGEELIIEGDAKKENGLSAKGVVSIQISNNDTEKIQASDSVKNGYFKLSVKVPEKMAAGQYLAQVDVYEIGEKGEKSNTGRSEERRVGKECRSRWSPYH